LIRVTSLLAVGMARAVLILALGSGCQLVVSLDGLDDEKCPSDQKRCDNRCVPRSDPSTGCALLSCAPCVLLHAKARCGDNGQCAVATCLQDYDDCDTQPGCETDLAHDPNHCGSCLAPPCATANGTAGCSAKMCATGGCNPGYEDCNRNPRDGCEVDLRSNAEHCGGCDHACASGQVCDAGACV
jgi:hypothetical protein